MAGVGFLVCVEEDERETEAEVGSGPLARHLPPLFAHSFLFPFFCSFTTIAKFLAPISLTFSLSMG